jgi:predicted porin
LRKLPYVKGFLSLEFDAFLGGLKRFSMQKKIVALAIAGLFSGAVYAQTNVTAYGRVDIGYTYSKSDYKKFQGIESNTGIGGGESHIGFRGEEALGNGLKAIFRLEWAITVDDGNGPGVGTANTAGVYSSGNRRYTYAGLAGNFGQVIAGRVSSPNDAYLGATGVRGFSNNAPINRFRGKVELMSDTVWENAISYTSPSFSGLEFMAAYSFGERVNSGGGIEHNNANEGADTSDAGKLGVGLKYANGPLYLTAGYEARKDDDSAKPLTNPTNLSTGYGAKAWFVGGTYDFKVVKVYANYFRGKANHNGWVNGVLAAGEAARKGSDKQTAWSLGAGIPVSSAGTIIAEYAQYKDYRDNRDGDAKVTDGSHSAGHKAKGYSLGYRHDLSKRTWLHAYVTRFHNDRGINAGWSKTGIAGEDQTILSTGIVHLF